MATTKHSNSVKRGKKVGLSNIAKPGGKTASQKQRRPEGIRTVVADVGADEYTSIDKKIDDLPLSPERKYGLRYCDPFRLAEDSLPDFKVKRALILHLESLKSRILLGYLPELRQLVDIAQRNVHLLNKLVDEHPRLVSHVAKEFDTWPCLCTLTSAPAQEKQRLKSINLGRGRRSYLAKTKSPAGIWAGKLFRFMQFVRTINGIRDEGAPTGYSNEDMAQFAPLELKLLVDRSKKAQDPLDPEFPEPVWLPLRNQICKLPSFKSDPKAWGSTARAILLLHSGKKPGTLDGLEMYVPRDLREDSDTEISSGGIRSWSEMS